MLENQIRILTQKEFMLIDLTLKAQFTTAADILKYFLSLLLSFKENKNFIFHANHLRMIQMKY